MAMTMKIDLDGDVRRLPIAFPDNTDVAEKWELLHQEIRQGFKLREGSSLVLKYKDEDGDLCTLVQHTLTDCLSQVPAGGPLRLIASLSAPTPEGPAAPEMQDPLEMLWNLKKIIKAAKGKGKGCGWRRRWWQQEGEMDASKDATATDATNEPSDLPEDDFHAEWMPDPWICAMKGAMKGGMKGFMFGLKGKGKGKCGKGRWWEQEAEDVGQEEPKDEAAADANGEPPAEWTPDPFAFAMKGAMKGFVKGLVKGKGKCGKGKWGKGHGHWWEQEAEADASMEEPMEEAAPDATEGPPTKAADEAKPTLSPCTGGCGFARTWHPTHCCGACAKGKGCHGKHCSQVPVAAPAEGSAEVTLPPAPPSQHWGKGKWGKGLWGKGKGKGKFLMQHLAGGAAGNAELQDNMAAHWANMAAMHAQHAQNVAQAQAASADGTPAFDWQQHMQQMGQHMQAFQQHMQQHQAQWAAAQGQAQSQAAYQTDNQWAPSAPEEK